MTASKPAAVRPWLWAAVALTLLKLWLTRGQTVFALAQANHDDRLFLLLAESITRGEWLGAYNQLTLAKGPFYSLWVAAVFWLGVPLVLAQQILYAGACAVFVRAGRPAIRSAAALFFIYALLLWNPMSFESSSLGRILRQQINPAQLLFIFAGLVALYYRRRESFRRQAPWAVLLGFAFGSFWLTREDAIWLVPGVALLLVVHLVAVARESRELFRRGAKMIALAVAFAALPLLAVSAMNYRHYHWFGTVEFRASAFRDAYGAMVRIEVGPDLPHVPVTRQAREAIYAVSPAFAELRPFLDGDIGRSWAGASEGVTGIPAAERQIGGGWMMWALRDAVAAAGHAKDAGQALEFYQRLADEINRACDASRLPAGPRRSGFLPPWREGQSAETVKTFFEFGDFVVRFSRFSASSPPSTGSAGDLQLFNDLTREELSPVTGVPFDLGLTQYLANAAKVRRLEWIGQTLRPGLLGLFLLAQTAFLLRLLQATWRRTPAYPLWLAAAVGGSGVGALLVQALVQVTSFPVMVISSFAAIYPLVLLFTAVALWDATTAGMTAWSGRKKPQPISIHPRLAPAVRAAAPISPALLWLAAFAALAPFLIWHTKFGQLFWFGDDFFLLDQITLMGFWRWTSAVFAENFVPMFKLLWGGSVLAFGGSYLAMLWLLWLTHALNTLLLGRLLGRVGFSLFATLATQLIFALSPTNLETLGWSVQWSAVLATMFLLAALLWHESYAERVGRHGWRLLVPLVLLSAASACSFSRGVLTGGVLALALLLPATAERDRRMILWRLPTSLLPLLPSLAVALAIALFSRGNFQQMDGHWGDAFKFGASYFLLNPLYALGAGFSSHPAALALLGGIKLGAITGGLWLTRDRMRWLLIGLLAYDLGNATLLGVGRYHTGFFAAMGSRYQYGSLIATLPFFTLVLGAGLERWLRHAPLQIWGKAIVLTAVILVLLRGWPDQLAEFTAWRGTGLRQLLGAPATTDPTAKVPALEFMHVERAKAIIRAYDLH